MLACDMRPGASSGLLPIVQLTWRTPSLGRLGTPSLCLGAETMAESQQAFPRLPSSSHRALFVDFIEFSHLSSDRFRMRPPTNFSWTCEDAIRFGHLLLRMYSVCMSLNHVPPLMRETVRRRYDVYLCFVWTHGVPLISSLHTCKSYARAEGYL